jgi:hypothetical protein
MSSFIAVDTSTTITEFDMKAMDGSRPQLDARSQALVEHSCPPNRGGTMGQVHDGSATTTAAVR